jgi:hypothetical protein
LQQQCRGVAQRHHHQQQQQLGGSSRQQQRLAPVAATFASAGGGDDGLFDKSPQVRCPSTTHLRRPAHTSTHPAVGWGLLCEPHHVMLACCVHGQQHALSTHRAAGPTMRNNSKATTISSSIPVHCHHQRHQPPLLLPLLPSPTQ